MKNLIVLLVLISSLISVHSQEKQNDATWAETIAFLNKYKSNITEIGTFGHINTYKISSISFENNKLMVTVDYGQVGRGKGILKKVKDMKYYADLIGLTRVAEIGENSGYLQIDFNEKTTYEGYIMDLRNDKTEYEFKKDEGFSWYILGFDSPEVSKTSEMFKRYFKSLKHLAYLAKKKREKERELRGDKF